MLEVIKNTNDFVGEVNIFDLYQEEKSTKFLSIGVEVEIIQKNKIFNSEEINFLMEKIIKNVEKKLGARLRESS